MTNKKQTSSSPLDIQAINAALANRPSPGRRTALAYAKEDARDRKIIAERPGFFKRILINTFNAGVDLGAYFAKKPNAATARQKEFILSATQLVVQARPVVGSEGSEVVLRVVEMTACEADASFLREIAASQPLEYGTPEYAEEAADMCVLADSVNTYVADLLSSTKDDFKVVCRSVKQSVAVRHNRFKAEWDSLLVAAKTQKVEAKAEAKMAEAAGAAGLDTAAGVPA